MRIFIRTAIALVIVVAAYWGWALAGAAQIASAASRGDAEAVMERVDLQALIRSLSSQISRAFLDENPQLQKLPSVRQGVVLNGAVWGMPSLGEAFNARPLQVLMNSYFDGPLSFVVSLNSPDGRYRVHMNLSGVTWRMSGVDIPEPVTARLARLIAQRIGGAVNLPGG